MRSLPRSRFAFPGRGGYSWSTRTPRPASSTFFLHIFPADKSELPPSRRLFGFNKLDFRFAYSGEFLDGGCIAQRLLPDYPIKRIRTGQHVPGERLLWQAKLLADMPPHG